MHDNLPTAEELIHSFNTWKYKREQPSDLAKLTEVIQKALDERKPIKFCMYWGKGDRDVIGDPEKEAFDFINNYLSRIKEMYSAGVDVTLIFTDTHAELNGYGNESIHSYFDSIKAVAEQFGFRAQFLSGLAPFVEQELLGEINQLAISTDLLGLLVDSCQKHYRGSLDFPSAAKLYFLQNQIEKKAVAEKFSDSIFITFNGNELNDLFPQALPIFHMYSLETGTSVKPWFI